jgi:hypothetical protein
MGLKLKNLCKIADVKVGERYCLTSCVNYEFIFIITKKTKKDISLTYLDGTKGIYYARDCLEVYEFPLTPVERELI